MSQKEATAALSAGLHTETDNEKGQAALANFRQAALDRLVALLSPLQQFSTDQPAQPQHGSSSEVPGPALLPREILKASLRLQYAQCG